MKLWLNEAAARSILEMPALIEAMQSALQAYSGGLAMQPVRSVVEVEPGQSFFATMPGFIKTAPALGAKLVTVFPGNANQGLPSHLATIVLLNPATGELWAILDGRYITEARTAAASAVAARLLSRQNSATLAIIGSGVQARSHLEALTHVRSFATIRCWSPTPSHVERFQEDAKSHRIQAASSAEAAVQDADVIVLVTSAAQPVLRYEWVKPGACVLAVGACRPYQREMDPALVARGRLFVDSRAAALQESGDILLAIQEGHITAAHISAEIGEVIAQPARGRRSDQEVTIFKSLGLAVEDLTAAKMVYDKALQLGIGVALA